VHEQLEIGPVTVLAVFAHPDDPEMACGGTLRRCVDAGGSVRIVVANAGDKGSFDPATDPALLADVRRDELAAAAGVLGADSWEIFGVPDGDLENTVELRERLVTEIRLARPDVVIAPDPTAVFFGDTYVNHHDHRAIGWAVLDACAPASASPLYFPGSGEPHTVSTVLLAGSLDPDVWIDIAAALESKIAAVQCHRSQVVDSDFVEEAVRARAAGAGADVGAGAAELFRRLRLG